MPLTGIGDIYQVSFVQRMYGQRILTVLHARLKTLGTSTDYITVANDLADSLKDDLILGPNLDQWRDLVTTDLKFDRIRAQVVFPARLVYVESIVGSEGTALQNTTTPVNTALSLTKRTDETGRKYVGRVQVAGISSANMENGVWSNNTLGDAGNAFAWLKNDYLTTGTGTTFKFCLINPTDTPVWTDVTDVIPQATIRTMRRRTVGVGE